MQRDLKYPKNESKFHIFLQPLKKGFEFYIFPVPWKEDSKLRSLPTNFTPPPRRTLGNVEHYDDVIMSVMASQITSLTIVYSIVYSDADQGKHQSSASLAFVRGIHRGPVNSPHKASNAEMFPFDDVIMIWAVPDDAFVFVSKCNPIELFSLPGYGNSRNEYLDCTYQQPVTTRKLAVSTASIRQT